MCEHVWADMILTKPVRPFQVRYRVCRFSGRRGPLRVSHFGVEHIF
jgi:hypothetical protein